MSGEHIRPYGLAGFGCSAGARRLCALLLSRAGNPPIELALWDGTVVGPSSATVLARLTVSSPRALVALFVDPDMQLGDRYAAGELSIEGDLVAFFEAAFGYRKRWRIPAVAYAASVTARAFGRRSQAERRNVEHHYEVGDEFYAQWLDSSLTYTCAYFDGADSSLEQAQHAKRERICRKLALRSGERVVEAGSGWGSLAVHMALHYGVEVDAYNLSARQVEYARGRAQQAGLCDQVRFHLDNWTQIEGEYDAFVSVGMLEHVGKAHYRDFGAMVRRVLGPGGRGLIHSIGRTQPVPTHPWISRRIFPGGYVPALSEMAAIFEPNELCIHDIENLRPHYARTTAEWLARFEANEARIVELVPQRIARTWKIYLAAATAGFTTGWLQLFQVVFTRSSCGANPTAGASD